MQIESQVITIDQAKRLKELGVLQQGLFGWIIPPENGCRPVDIYVMDGDYLLIRADIVMFKANGKDAWVAFTVGELGTLLPNAFNTMRMHKFCLIDFNDFEIEQYTGGEGWKPYDEEDNDPLGDDVFFDTEAQARAAMLIHLLETGKITPEEVNQRLTANS